MKAGVFVLGGPGCGKGTQCSLLVENHNCVHVWAGELIRQEMKKDTEEAKIIHGLLSEGKLVPSSISWTLLKNSLDLYTDCSKLYLIDGYPRKHENYDEWVVQNDQSDNKVDIKWVLYIEVPDDIMLERVIERAKIENREFDDLGMYFFFWFSFQILLYTYRHCKETSPIILWWNLSCYQAVPRWL